jgi:hypothetical protein
MSKNSISSFFFQVSHILEVKEIERRIKQGEELLMLLITCL